MAYGQRTTPADAEFGFFNIFGVGLASALGIGTAVVVDLLQQREASALFVINRWILEVTELVGLGALPLYCVMLILMAVGGLSIFVFQPVTFRGGFAQGFGLLATLLTLAPSDIGAPLGAPEGQPELSVSSAEVHVVPTSLQRGAERATQGQKYQVRLQIEFPEGLRNDWQTMIRWNNLTGKLYNPETGVRYDLFRNTGAEVSYEDNVLRIRSDITASSDSGDLYLLVEAAGYEILEDKVTVQRGPNKIWSVTLTPTNMPLVLQRLGHRYTF